MSARVGPPGPSCINSEYVSGANSGSSSRPPATRCRNNVSQSRSSGSRRYHAVRRELPRAQSPSSVVLPKPASATTSATRPVAAWSSQPLSRSRDSVSARMSGGWMRAPTIGNGFMPSRPARPPRSIAPAIPGPTPTSAWSSGPRTGSTVPAVPPRRRPWPRTIRTPDCPRQRGRQAPPPSWRAGTRLVAGPSRWSACPGSCRAPLIGRLSEIHASRSRRAVDDPSALVLEADLEIDQVLDDLAVLDPRRGLHDLDRADVANGLATRSRRPAERRRSTIGGSSRPSRG